MWDKKPNTVVGTFYDKKRIARTSSYCLCFVNNSTKYIWGNPLATIELRLQCEETTDSLTPPLTLFCSQLNWIQFWRIQSSTLSYRTRFNQSISCRNGRLCFTASLINLECLLVNVYSPKCRSHWVTIHERPCWFLSRKIFIAIETQIRKLINRLAVDVEWFPNRGFCSGQTNNLKIECAQKAMENYGKTVRGGLQSLIYALA